MSSSSSSSSTTNQQQGAATLTHSVSSSTASTASASTTARTRHHNSTSSPSRPLSISGNYSSSQQQQQQQQRPVVSASDYFGNSGSVARSAMSASFSDLPTMSSTQQPPSGNNTNNLQSQESRTLASSASSPHMMTMYSSMTDASAAPNALTRKRSGAGSGDSSSGGDGGLSGLCTPTHTGAHTPSTSLVRQVGSLSVEDMSTTTTVSDMVMSMPLAKRQRSPSPYPQGSAARATSAASAAGARSNSSALSSSIAAAAAAVAATAANGSDSQVSSINQLLTRYNPAAAAAAQHHSRQQSQDVTLFPNIMGSGTTTTTATTLMLVDAAASISSSRASTPPSSQQQQPPPPISHSNGTMLYAAASAVVAAGRAQPAPASASATALVPLAPCATGVYALRRMSGALLYTYARAEGVPHSPRLASLISWSDTFALEGVQQELRRVIGTPHDLHHYGPQRTLFLAARPSSGLSTSVHMLAREMQLNVLECRGEAALAPSWDADLVQLVSENAPCILLMHRYDTRWQPDYRHGEMGRLFDRWSTLEQLALPCWLVWVIDEPVPSNVFPTYTKCTTPPQLFKHVLDEWDDDQVLGVLQRMMQRRGIAVSAAYGQEMESVSKHTDVLSTPGRVATLIAHATAFGPLDPRGGSLQRALKDMRAQHTSAGGVRLR